MLHKAWNSKGEMPYCFPRSSIKFQSHTGQNISDFDPNWAFPDYRLVAAFKSLRFAFLCFNGITKIEAHIFNSIFTLTNSILSLLLQSNFQKDINWSWPILAQVMACCILHSCLPILVKSVKNLPFIFFKKTYKRYSFTSFIIAESAYMIS